MKRTLRDSHDQERLRLFAKRLNRFLKEKHWSGADLAREASKCVPDTHKDKNGRRHVVGRHIVSAYSRGENEPTVSNLLYLATALGIQTEELLPPKRSKTTTPHVQAFTSLGGNTRLVIDAEIETAVAMQIIELVRGSINKSD